jgi:hypothetical protein
MCEIPFPEVVMEVAYLAGIFLFFGLMAALAVGCDKLGNSKPGGSK